MAELITTPKDGHERYVFLCRYEEHFPAKAARFRWDKTGEETGHAKAWWTDSPERAYELIQWADPPTERSLRASVEESSALEDATGFELKVPPGVTAYPHQVPGVKWLVDRKRTLLADSMGLGKTFQQVVATNHLEDEVTTWLLVCPKTLMRNWKREIEMFSTRRPRIQLITDVKQRPVLLRAGLDVVIVNYDKLAKMKAWIDGEEWDLVTFDEAHQLKNDKAQRTKAAFGSWKKATGWNPAPIDAKRTVLITGTAFTNRPIEAWPLLRYIDADRFASRHRYGLEYCDAHQELIPTRGGRKHVWNYAGASNMDRWQRLLRREYMLRREMEEVFTEMPKKVRQTILIEADTEELRRAAAEMDSFFARDPIARKALADMMGTSETVDQTEAEARRGDYAAAFAEMARLRYVIGVAKIGAVADVARNILEEEPAIFIPAWHQDVVDGLADELKEYGVVTLTGKTPADERQANIDAFQRQDGPRVFIGNIKAAGVGITLTRARVVLCAEHDFVPGNMSQVEDRCYRIGQTRTVLVYHVVVQDSTDEQMARTLTAKQRVFDEAFSKDRMEPARREEAKVTVKGVDPENLPEPMSFAQVRALQEATRMLAAADPDHATERNGYGFNGADGEFGHSLAGQPEWSAKQAFAARKMMRKYRRQYGDELFATIYGREEEAG